MKSWASVAAAAASRTDEESRAEEAEEMFGGPAADSEDAEVEMEAEDGMGSPGASPKRAPRPARRGSRA